MLFVCLSFIVLLFVGFIAIVSFHIISSGGSFDLRRKENASEHTRSRRSASIRRSSHWRRSCAPTRRKQHKQTNKTNQHTTKQNKQNTYTNKHTEATRHNTIKHNKQTNKKTNERTNERTNKQANTHTHTLSLSCRCLQHLFVRLSAEASVFLSNHLIIRLSVYRPISLIITSLSVYPSTYMANSKHWSRVWARRRYAWVFIKAGCSRRGVQWMGVVLYNKPVYNII